MHEQRPNGSPRQVARHQRIKHDLARHYMPPSKSVTWGVMSYVAKADLHPGT